MSESRHNHEESRHFIRDYDTTIMAPGRHEYMRPGSCDDACDDRETQEWAKESVDVDPELDAMRGIGCLLDKFDQTTARRRILKWAMDKYGAGEC